MVTIANGVPLLPAPAGAPPLTVPGPLLTAIGRLSPEKNHQLLIALLPDLPEVHVALAGVGPLMTELADLAHSLGVSDRLHLLGALDRQEIANLLGATHLVVLPSLSEGLSLALVEALGAGVPVVASALATNQAVAGDAARLIPVEDNAAWLSTLRDLLNNPKAREQLAAAGRQRAQQFDPQAMGDAYLALMNHA
jgi:glycosyltransferase involved in cell wall biosynthesis